jgi:hypothetical protein
MHANIAGCCGIAVRMGGKAAAARRHSGTVAGSACLRLSLAVALLLLGGCTSETLFKSNFDATPVGQPPAQVQAVGTANVDGPPGSVVVVGAPAQSTGRWVQITRANQQPSVSGLQGNLSVFKGPGQYTFSAAMFIPSGVGLATIQFEPFGQPPSTLTNFLHIDFTTDNMVRIDDNDATKFGSFPRDQVFAVFVTLATDASPPTARITLVGAGTSGQADYVILPALRPMSQQFGAVRVWMGFPWTGSFDSTEIVVTHRTN